MTYEERHHIRNLIDQARREKLAAETARRASRVAGKRTAYWHMMQRERNAERQRKHKAA